MKKSLLGLLFLALGGTIAIAQRETHAFIASFSKETGALNRIDKRTNSLSFMRFPAGKALGLNGGGAREKSEDFVRRYNRLFGVRPGVDELTFKDQRTDGNGMEHVTLRQLYRGIPVFDGTIKLHFNKAKGLSSLNGNYITDIKVNPAPTLPAERAVGLALQKVRGSAFPEPEDGLKAGKPELYIFQKGLAQGYNGSKHLVYEIEVFDGKHVREYVYIDAHSGAVVEQFSGIHQALNRRLYEGSINPANQVWTEGQPFPGSLTEWQQAEVAVSGHIYHLMKNTFGVDSYNNQGAAMVTVNNSPNISCPNAQWNGTSANYCDGTASDDVVAHEWAHAYTEYTSGLIYAWQAGALNESYSDIWGETVDLLNGYMDEGENNGLRTACGSSARWMVGEKATAFGGAIRDMWSPNCKGDPASVSDPLYHCLPGDQGGVHINSGVHNHLYALLVDGGSYNGYTITGIGLTKAAHIFWKAQADYMIKTIDFASQADILETVANELIGVNLAELSLAPGTSGLSGQELTADDVLQVTRAIVAVGLRDGNNCQFLSFFDPAPALCEGASPEHALFQEDFENGLGGFAASLHTMSGSFTPRNWVVESNAPGGRTGKVAFAVDPGYGDCSVSVQAGVLRLESPVVTIPAGTAGNLNLVFDHYVATEAYWDGGNLKYSINNGSWTLLPASAFTANGYNCLLNSAVAGSDNPLAGQPGFSGSDQGTLTGSWGQSQVDLSALGLKAGDALRLRWEFGTDCGSGVMGWYLDNVRVYTCAVTPAVHFVHSSDIVNEGAANAGADCRTYVEKEVAIQVDKAPSQPVSLTVVPVGGTAEEGENADYLLVANTLTLDAANLTGFVKIRIYNDSYVEGEETVVLALQANSNGGDAYLAGGIQQTEFIITDDDQQPGNTTETLLNTGFNKSFERWKIIKGGSTSLTWTIAEYSGAALDPGGRPFLFANSDATRMAQALTDEIAESPVMNAAGKKNMVLSFLQDWRPYVGGYAEVGTVDVWDGTSWQNLLTQTESTGRRGDLTGAPDLRTIPIPDAYANREMKVRFHYKAQYDYWWAVDNVKITASNSTSIRTAVTGSSPAEAYLGPHGTAVFYEPATGQLLAKIQNNTDHDYGCTTVEVDRAGVDGTSWFGNYTVSQKTFKVTPAVNKADGDYTITLYYKSAELPNYRASVKSMGKSSGAISSGNTGNRLWAEVQQSSAFDNDFAYTARFTSGFSGFALSDAPPVGSLPVALAYFEGERTGEGGALRWETTRESDNAFFVVERSPDGRQFAEVGRVSGKGTISERSFYNFLDATLPPGKSYYRLRQVDRSGKWELSRQIVLEAGSLAGIKYYPNPVHRNLNLELPDRTLETAELRVLSAAGQEVVGKRRIHLKNGKITTSLALLPAGVYQVVVYADRAVYRFAVVKD